MQDAIYVSLCSDAMLKTFKRQHISEVESDLSRFIGKTKRKNQTRRSSSNSG